MLFLCLALSFPMLKSNLSLGVPGDGRCLFRSVVHGACLRAGKASPTENCERELADELRAMMADEFIKKSADSEWVPRTVHMLDKRTNSVKIIAEYGQEYGKENPAREMYHGYGHLTH